MVKSGCHWQIDNGESASVWGDKWLPNPSTFQVTSPVRVLHPQAWVLELIDNQMGAWNSVLVRQIFFEHDADSILSIPLSLSLPPDSRV